MIMIITRNIPDAHYQWQRRKIRHILIGTYGWPDSFNEERYREERQELWTRVWEEYRNLGEPRLV